MNYEGLQNQRQKIRKYFSAKNTFSTGSTQVDCEAGKSSGYNYQMHGSILRGSRFWRLLTEVYMVRWFRHRRSNRRIQSKLSRIPRLWISLGDHSRTQSCDKRITPQKPCYLILGVLSKGRALRSWSSFQISRSNEEPWRSPKSITDFRGTTLSISVFTRPAM